MNQEAIATQTISALAGILLSLAFAYVPGLADWFKAQAGTTKRLVLLAALAAVALAPLALNCSGLLHAAPCTAATALDAAPAFIAALVANQAAYTLAP